MTGMQMKPASKMNTPVGSKINWTAMVTVVFSLLAVFGLDIPPEQQVKVIGAIATLGSMMTVIWRTFFTEPTTTEV